MDGTPAASDDEVDRQDWRLRDRYRELLEELRTIIPGVQVLFAFLLTVPFSSRFTELDPLGRRVFTGSLVAAALATVVFLSPAAYHRVNEQEDRRRRLAVSIRAELLGMALLGIAVVSAIFVVVRFIFATAVGGVMAGLITTAGVIMWWVLPAIDRPARQSSEHSREHAR